MTILGKASKNKCMVGKLIQEFSLFLMNGEQGAVVWNCSYVNTWKDKVNGKPIRSYVGRFHTELSKVPE